MAKVTFHEVVNYFDPRERITSSVQAYPGCTPRAHAPEAGAGVEIIAILNGRKIELDEWDSELRGGDDVTFVAVPEGITAAGVGAFFVKLIVSAAVSYAVGALLAPSKPQTTKEDQESETYGFSNLQRNAVHEGGAVQVGYGEHRVAPQIVNVFRRSTITPINTTVYVMGSLGHGPIESIGQYTTDQDDLIGTAIPKGILINGQPAENFTGIECWLRLGTEEQLAVPGFEDSVSEPPVDKVLEYDTTAAETTTGVYVAADLLDGGSAYWPAAQAFTMTEDADVFANIVTFASGLFNINSNGSLLSNAFECQIRYTEVDGGGVPFGDTVVLPAEAVLDVAKKSPFSVEYRHDFIDPSTYTAPTQGRYLEADYTGNPSKENWAVAAAPAYPIATLGLTEFSVSAWIRPAWTLSASNTWKWKYWAGEPGIVQFKHVLIDRLDESSSKGFRVELRTSADYFPLAPLNASIEGLFLRCYIGNGSAIKVYSSNVNRFDLAYAFVTGPGQPIGSPWNALSITYKGSGASTGSDDGEIRFYVNDVQFGSTISVPSANRLVTADGTEPITIGVQQDQDKVTMFMGDFDQVRLYTRAIDEFEVAQIYNSGKGHKVTGSEVDLLYAWEFDSASGSPLVVSEELNPGGSGDLELGADTTVSSGTDYGPVSSVSTGTFKRSKYKIEMQRLNVADNSTSAQDEATWDSVQLVTNETFTRPGKALIALKIPSQGQLNTNLPAISVLSKLRKVWVWDQVSSSMPTGDETWTDNPAWILADAATNRIYGAGGHYEHKDLDLPKFQEFADRCDTLRRDSLGVSDAVRIDFVAGSPDEVLIICAPGSLPSHIAVGTKLGIENAYDTIGAAAAPSWDIDLDAGEYMEVLSIDTSQAPALEQWHCSWPSTKSAPTPTTGAEGEIFGLEKRFTFNGVFDAPIGSWDALVRIAQTAWATPVKIGSRLSIFFDDPASPIALVSMGNVKDFKVRYSGVADRPNSIEAEYLSKTLNYERRYVTVDHDTALDPTLFNQFRKRRMALHGVTSLGQILRHCKHELNVLFLLRKAVSFTVGVDSLHYSAGDVITVSHDVPQWGFSGRLLTDSSTDTVVKLDRDVEIDGVSTYELQIRDSVTDQLVTRTVSTAVDVAAGADLTVSAGFGFVPKKSDLYSFGLTSASSKDFRITKTVWDPLKLEHQIEAIEYNAAVYDDNFSEVPDSVSALPPVVFESTLPQQAQSVVVSDGSYRGPSGAVIPAIHVSWTHDAQTIASVAGAKVYISTNSNESPKLVATASGGQTAVTFTDQSISRGNTYRIRVVPYNAKGVHRDPARSPAYEFTFLGATQLPEAPTAVEVTQNGGEVVYKWTMADEFEKGSTIEVRSGGWPVASTLFQTRGTQEAFRSSTALINVPTNTLGSPAPKHIMRVGTRSGDWSVPTYFEVDIDLDGYTLIQEESLEEDWATGATLTGMAVTSMASTPGIFVPSSVLDTTGPVRPSINTYESKEIVISGEARRVFVSAYLETWGGDTNATWSDDSGAWGDSGSDDWGGSINPNIASGDEGALAELLWDISETGTLSGNYVPFQPGIYKLKRWKFKIDSSRTTLAYAAKINRLAYSCWDLPVYSVEIDGGSW